MNVNIDIKGDDSHLLYSILKSATQRYVIMFPWAPDATGVEYGLIIKIFEDENNFYAVGYRIYNTMDDYEAQTTIYTVPKSSTTLNCFKNLILLVIIDEYGINDVEPTIRIFRYFRKWPKWAGPDNGITLEIIGEMECYAGKHLEYSDYIQLLNSLDSFIRLLRPYVNIIIHTNTITVYSDLTCRDIENIARETGIDKYWINY